MMKTTSICAAGALLALLLSLAQAGAAPAGQTCGGEAACDRGLWCEPAPGACYSPPESGVCTPVPQICTRIYLPVCGCDGRTYGNDCERRGRRVPKAHDGAC